MCKERTDPSLSSKRERVHPLCHATARRQRSVSPPGWADLPLRLLRGSVVGPLGGGSARSGGGGSGTPLLAGGTVPASGGVGTGEASGGSLPVTASLETRLDGDRALLINAGELLLLDLVLSLGLRVAVYTC